MRLVNKQELLDRCIILRKQGLSYSEIRKQVPLAKSTLHYWFKTSGLTLSKEHFEIQSQKRIENWEIGVLAAKKTRLDKSTQHVNNFLNQIKLNFSDPLLIAGCFVYQAEGSKTESCNFANSDFRLIKVFINFVERYFEVDRIRNLRYRLYIHQIRRADTARITTYWAKKLNIPVDLLRITWKNNIAKRKRKNKNYVGLVCIVVVGKSLMLRKMLALSGIIVEKYCGVV